jgi:MATE family multidrug resistance protein
MSFSFFKSSHTRETFNLAWPLIITQVGHIITGMVDNIFLGRIGVAEQAAGILSNNLYVLLLVFAIGMSYATTPLVTLAHEENDLLKKASLFKNSLVLNLVVSSVCFIILFFSSGSLHYMQQPEEVVTLAVPFFDVLIFSIVPVSLFFSCKQYCEGLSNTRMALLISIVGNLLNILLNYCLIYGKLGLPEMGYLGSAWATFFARLFMGLSFLWLVFRAPLTREIKAVYKNVKVNRHDLLSLWRIGWNSAMQFTFEVAAFVIAGLFAGRLGKENIDAHGIALSIASFTYMFGSAIGSAATIRIGIFRSQQNYTELRKAVWSSLKLVLLVMGFFAGLFIFSRASLPYLFTSDPQIAGLAATLLLIAAMFQLFDGVQVVMIGILRAVQDVKYPTYVTLFAYWVVALPLGWILAFQVGLGTIGIWLALLLSLILVSVLLFVRVRFLIHPDRRPETDTIPESIDANLQ